MGFEIGSNGRRHSPFCGCANCQLMRGPVRWQPPVYYGSPEKPSAPPAAKRKLVVIESPFAGEVGKNVEYARRCLKHSADRGEAPIASHLLFAQDGIFDDNNPVERMHGIAAGLAWHRVAELVAFYIDRGISPGMVKAAEHARAIGVKIEFRSLDRSFAP